MRELHRQSSCGKNRPIAVRALEICFGIDSRANRLVDQRHADRNSRGERSQLLEALDLLEWTLAAARPTASAPSARTRTLRCAARRACAATRRPPRRARNGIGGSRKIHGSTVVGSDDFHDIRIGENRPASRETAAVPTGYRALGHHARRAEQIASRETNGSSPCTFTMTSKSANSGRRATSATRCVPDGWSRAGHHDLAAVGRARRRRPHRCRSRQRRARRRQCRRTRCQTRTTSGRPARRRRGFRGRRVAPSRAGMTASVFMRRARSGVARSRPPNITS